MVEALSNVNGRHTRGSCPNLADSMHAQACRAWSFHTPGTREWLLLHKLSLARGCLTICNLSLQAVYDAALPLRTTPGGRTARHILAGSLAWCPEQE